MSWTFYELEKRLTPTTIKVLVLIVFIDWYNSRFPFKKKTEEEIIWQKSNDFVMAEGIKLPQLVWIYC